MEGKKKHVRKRKTKQIKERAKMQSKDVSN
jgi:hypothetical protein